MLDLNFLRNNLETVRKALQHRNYSTELLDDFIRNDTERREVIAKSDSYNAQLNAASREIGALIKEGKKKEADERREEVNELKKFVKKSGMARFISEDRIRKILEVIPNIPHESVPVG